MKRSVPRHEVTQPLDKPWRFIPLTKGQDAIVDVEDFEWLSQWNWCASWSPYTQSFYAQRLNYAAGKIMGHIKMHRAILGSQSKEVDHANGDTLDNRRRNIRDSTHSQNSRNRGMQANNKSGFKGVNWNKKTSSWQSQINIGGKKRWLGYFPTAEQGAKAYNEAAKIYHGEFAHLNATP